MVYNNSPLSSHSSVDRKSGYSMVQLLGFPAGVHKAEIEVSLGLHHRPGFEDEFVFKLVWVVDIIPFLATVGRSLHLLAGCQQGASSAPRGCLCCVLRSPRARAGQAPLKSLLPLTASLLLQAHAITLTQGVNPG